MTNEEASIIVGNIPINGDECYSIPEYQQAKAMAIEALEQQPKTGAWVPVDAEPHDICECNVCGWLLYYEDRTDFKYCPNCGARMIESQKSKR